jgi:membrane-anchored protein YejM (alkaline phosphatase superfamily)
MFVRDSAIARIFLGPTVYFQQKNIFYIAGQLPVLFYDFNDPNYQFGINGVNGLNNPTFTGPSPPLAANNNNSPAAAKEKIPRPPNAFILYRKFHHPSIVAQHPGIHNNAVCKF